MKLFYPSTSWYSCYLFHRWAIDTLLLAFVKFCTMRCIFSGPFDRWPMRSFSLFLANDRSYKTALSSWRKSKADLSFTQLQWLSNPSYPSSLSLQPSRLSIVSLRVSFFTRLVYLSLQLKGAITKRVTCPDGVNTATNAACCALFAVRDDIQVGYEFLSLTFRVNDNPYRKTYSMAASVERRFMSLFV